MKLQNAKWCVQCDELFNSDGACPFCTNRLNIMRVKDYMCVEHKEVPRAKHRK